VTLRLDVIEQLVLRGDGHVQQIRGVNARRQSVG
jgi:hypothetical protein